MQEGSNLRLVALLSASAGLSFVLNMLLMTRLCDLAVRARWPLLPVLTLASLTGLVALGLGTLGGPNSVFGLPRLGMANDVTMWQWLCFASGIALAVTLLLLPKIPAVHE